MRDPVFLISFLVTGGAAVPYLVLTEPAIVEYASVWADLPIVAMAVLSVLVGINRESGWAERRFWRFVAAAMCAWLAVRVVYAIVPDESWYDAMDLVTDSFFLAFYMSLLLALDVHPETRTRPDLHRSLMLIRQTGATLFGFGLLLYFVIIPHTLDYDRYWTWVPSLVFYVFLDSYLVLRFYALYQEARSRKWRVIFAGFLITGSLWTITDLLELLIYMEAIPWPAEGASLDLIWFLPFVSFFVTVRLRGADHAAVEPGPVVRRNPSMLGRLLWAASGGPLVAYAFAFPLIHFVAYLLGDSNEEARAAREVLVLGGLLAFGTLALWQQRMMDSERRKYNADLTRLASTMLRQQEEERLRLSRELHDETAQVFTAVKMKLGLIREGERADESGLDRAMELIDEGIQSIRDVARDLRPALLDEMGLMPALNALIESAREDGLEVELEAPEVVVGMSAEAELTVFRMVQEGLTNVYRHSDARSATVTMTMDRDNLNVEVADHGIPTHSVNRIGMGLAGMRERVTMVGGNLEIESGDEVGWVLRASIPVGALTHEIV